MPTPTAPVGQYVTAGSGRATVYGATVSARHDATVFHAMGFDAGDLIRRSVEEATRLREAERHAVGRPLMPGSSHPGQPGFPAVPHGSLDNSYQEDDFSINAPLQCAPRSPTTVKMPSDGVHHNAANDRKDSGLFPQEFVMNPPGHQSSGKGSYGVGQTLDFVVTFSEGVFVNGNPSIAVNGMTSGARQAAYLAGSGTNRLTFRYVVQAGDALAPKKNLSLGKTISLVGASIFDRDAKNPATVSFSPPSLSGVRIASV
jgi:hypothetical protein